MDVSLRVEEGANPGALFPIPAGETVWIGGDPRATITLAGIAPRQAAVRFEDGHLRVVDLAGGGALNDEPLVPNRPASLGGGDGLRFGAHLLRVNAMGARRERQALRTQRLADPVMSALEADYVLEGQIGAGASGRVYGARRRIDERKVAIKLLHERFVPGSDDHRRFLREGRIGLKLKSPHIVEVLEHRVVDGRAFIVMELIEGPSLRDRLAGGPLPVDFVLGVAHDVAQALDQAAQSGVVHRDVKPANVVLVPGGGPAKLVDFGLAKDLDGTIASLTKSGQGFGTMAYLPPEQVAEAKYADPRADLYSLGAMLYHLLAGEPPFRIRDPNDLVKILDDPPPPLLERRPDCPPPVAEFVHELLAKEPEDRPAAFRVLERIAELRG